MNTICLIILFLLGTEWGSFYTLLGDRIPKKEKYFGGKSYCDQCGHQLYFFDKIPILSFLFLQGRCRYCHEKISPLSTYMEFFTGILFALAFYIFGFSFEYHKLTDDDRDIYNKWLLARTNKDFELADKYRNIYV